MNQAIQFFSSLTLFCQSDRTFNVHFYFKIDKTLFIMLQIIMQAFLDLHHLLILTLYLFLTFSNLFLLTALSNHLLHFYLRKRLSLLLIYLMFLFFVKFMAILLEYFPFHSSDHCLNYFYFDQLKFIFFPFFSLKFPLIH